MALVNVLESRRLELQAVRVRIVITVGRRHYHLRTPDRVICPAKVLLCYFGTVLQGTLVQSLLAGTGTAVVLGTCVKLWYFGTE